MRAPRAGITLALVGGAVASLAACIEPRIRQPVASLRILPESAVVYLDSAIAMAAAVFDPQGRQVNDRPVAWLTLDTTIASISPSGRLQGLTVGKTTLVAASDTASARAPATVVVSYSTVATGGWTCAMALSGHPYCWGSDQATPVLVPGPVTFASVTPGALHACELTAAGVAYCHSSESQALGSGRHVSSATPLPVAGGLQFGMLSAGNEFTCGITTAGAAYCWGSDLWGKLGVGGQPGSFSDVPVPVAGGLTFTSVSAGSRHACGITTAGDAYCWGDNTAGELGTATPDTVFPRNPEVVSRVPVLVGGVLKFRAISAGGEFTCALTASGAVYCWGDNGAGQLGAAGGTGCQYSRVDFVGYPCSEAPLRAGGNLTLVSVDAAQGGSHVCGLAADGTAYCWGNNVYGQLGAPPDSGGPAPIQAAGGFKFRVIGAAADHTCGLTLQGVIYCWGSGFGISSPGSPVPTRVPYQR